jgi:hypothetical protein
MPGIWRTEMDDNNSKWNPKVIGIILGLAIGLVLVFAGALNAFILGGWLIGKYIAGEIDLDDLYDRYLRGRTKRLGR